MCDSLCFFLMKRRPPRPTRTDTLFPDTTPFRSAKARLYNLAADPTEQHDLSAQQPQRVAQLSAMIEAQNRDMAKPIWPGLVEGPRSEEHTAELQSLMSISYAVFCLKTKNSIEQNTVQT